ncbi:N,N-dimethylformamidase beta subunit family domain-containing protein [Streptosporangium sp. NPDC051022]|uniref:N,N-dimethylformamidase beta subunit family domain-containing protein n=1 Tax=Streptosporangium sp. NPDC051022 TaxID=3155752 RepID=UPI0034404BA9
MTVYAYAESTSCVQNGTLRFHLAHTSRAPARGVVRVEDVAADLTTLTGTFEGSLWTLDVPADWSSSLYRAVFTAEGNSSEVYFVVRAATPSSPILLSIPFPTWQAYNRAGIPGESIYWTEQPNRAAKVSFDRPGGGPPPERWEEGMLRWLSPAGYDVDYCSGLDLHDGAALLSGYRLLVVNGHDEYWSAGMRDNVEEFVRRGGNLAVFSGNTCWWQFRLEDDGRTMVCYRDAAADPMATVDPGLTTVEWSSAPVNRPENGLTGVSFRRGAGTWGPYMQRMHEESYTVRFPEHWVFAGTGLGEGDKFGQGAIGYETDACDFAEVDGIPLATGRDGTPPSFVILATADLRHWHRYGQGGMATMGAFGLGAGTVFTASTVNWGNTLHDPAVDRITRNVLDRLSTRTGGWELIGGPGSFRALTVFESRLYGVAPDGGLFVRDVSAQNLRWRPAGTAPEVVAMATPREATTVHPIGLYGLTSDARLVYLNPGHASAPGAEEHAPDPGAAEQGWITLGDAPSGAVGLGMVNGELFAATAESLWRLSPDTPGWTLVDSSCDAVALTAMNGRLYAVDARGRVRTRLPVATPAEWTDLCDAGGCTVLTAHAGTLIGTGPDRPLLRRAPVPDL